jgi:hypothetical protein
MKQRWVERRRCLRRFWLIRSLERYFAIRLAFALTAAFLMLVMVNRWEKCRQNEMAIGCLVHDAGGVLSVGNLEALSIMTASFLFVLEAGQRRQRDHLDAMELILSCRQAGVRFSYARNQALERLADAGIWLDGQDFSGIVLDDIRLPGARMQGVNLSCTSLRQADLTDCDLRGANLRNVDLRGARLQGACLEDACLEGALMDGALGDKAPFLTP